MFKKGILSAVQRLIPSSLSKLKMHSSTRIVLCSSYDKHLPIPSNPTPLKKAFAQDTDILLEQLLKAPTIERILELTSLHLDVMNSKHIVACFSSVHAIIRVQDAELLSLTKDEIFQDLCARMMKVVRGLDSNELLTIYKTLAGLKIRSNTFVMQSLLKMLGGHLNNMTLNQLNFLSFLLNKQRPNSLVDGLKLALPLVLQVQIDQQIDSNDVNEIVNCLRLASKSRLKTATIEKIINTLLDSAASLNVDQAVTVIFSLLSLQSPVDGYKELIEASFNIISKDTEQLDTKAILPIVKLCVTQNFYHHKFLNSACQKALSEKWDLDSSSQLVKSFHNLDVSYPLFLDYLSKLICLEADSILRDPIHFPLSFVEYFTNSGYRPSHIEGALNVLCSCKVKLERIAYNQPHLMVKFVSCLALLNYFPRDIFSHALNEEYLFNAWSSSKQYGRAMQFERNIFELVWSLEVYDQNKTFQISPSLLKKIISALQQRCVESEYPLKKFIESGLGGSQFLLSGVFTKDGHVIDHLLAMRSGSYPVSLQENVTESRLKSNSITYVEDIELPKDATIIPVIVANEDQYCMEPEVLKASTEIKIKSLIKKSFSPVVINYKTWTNLPDREKIPYLMREIKQALEIEKPTQTNYVHDCI